MADMGDPRSRTGHKGAKVLVLNNPQPPTRKQNKKNKTTESHCACGITVFPACTITVKAGYFLQIYLFWGDTNLIRNGKMKIYHEINTISLVFVKYVNPDTRTYTRKYTRVHAYAFTRVATEKRLYASKIFA